MTQFSPLPLMKAIQWFKTKMVTSMVSTKTYMQIKTTLSFQFNSLKMYKTVLISATAKLNIYTNLWLILKKDKTSVTVTSIIITQGFGTSLF